MANSEGTVGQSFCPNDGSPMIAENRSKFPSAVIVIYGTMALEAGIIWKPELNFFCKHKEDWRETPAEAEKFHELCILHLTGSYSLIHE
jgi:hypothetical protein